MDENKQEVIDEASGEDMNFVMGIITQIATYATEHKFESVDDTIRDVAQFMTNILDICTFNRWSEEKND